MLFSRYQLQQLAKVNSSSLHQLLSKQKKLEGLRLTKTRLSDNIKQVIRTKKNIPGDTGVFKSSLNIDLLKTLGYKDLDDLITQLSLNEEEISNEYKEVKVLKEKVKTSMDMLKNIDTNKDMEDQVINEVILDSDIAEIRSKSQEILLMLSTEKDSSFLSKSHDMIKTNEEKISKYLGSIQLDHDSNRDSHNKKVDDYNGKISSMNSDMKKIIDGDDQSIFSKLDSKLSQLSSTKKNLLLGSVFVTSLVLGLRNKKKSKD